MLRGSRATRSATLARRARLDPKNPPASSRCGRAGAQPWGIGTTMSAKPHPLFGGRAERRRLRKRGFFLLANPASEGDGVARDD
jgi:hypothetical protein